MIEIGETCWSGITRSCAGELKAFRGREMDTAGDGFFAVFEVPDQAVRCAESIVRELAQLDLQVRAGIHTGECEVVSGKVAGMAVVIGSRIAALAEPGQVLVSGSVRDLTTGSGVGFEGGDLQALKGMAELWRVYRAVPDENGGTGTSGRLRRVPLYTRRGGRRMYLAGAAVLITALVVPSVYLLTRPDPSVLVSENAVGMIGPGDDGRITAAVDVGQRPTGVAGAGGIVWVTNSTSNSVSRIDTRTNISVPLPVDPSRRTHRFGAAT